MSSAAVTPEAHQLLEVLIEFGIAGTGYGFILAVVGRASSSEDRSMAVGIVTAAGSIGQVVGSTLAEWMLTEITWQSVFLIFSATILVSLLFLPFMRATNLIQKTELQETMGSVLKKAFSDPTYTMIFLGFLVVVINLLSSLPISQPSLPKYAVLLLHQVYFIQLEYLQVQRLELSLFR